jgi:hypothetical protein
VIPPSLNLAETEHNLAALDVLRSRTMRLRQLLGKGSGLEPMRATLVTPVTAHARSKLGPNASPLNRRRSMQRSAS